MTRDPNTCSSCGRPILWTVSTKGKRAPLDPNAVVDGNVILDGVGWDANGRQLPKSVVLRKGETPLGDPLRFVSHFVTCPDAKLHKGRR